MQNSDIAQQPLFYLFIAATVLLSLGYTWGRRRNNKIYLSAFNALVEALKPKDQRFTNIGGLTGYHAHMVPHKNRFIHHVEATITLLPRQSWLYYPFSRMIRRFDRLFVTMIYSKKAENLMGEGHLIEEKFSAFRGPKISHADKLKQETLDWGNYRYRLYYEREDVKKELIGVIGQLEDPGVIRHIALMPDQAHFFMIPRRGEVAKVFPPLSSWLHRLVEQRYNLKNRRAE